MALLGLSKELFNKLLLEVMKNMRKEDNGIRLIRVKRSVEDDIAAAKERERKLKEEKEQLESTQFHSMEYFYTEEFRDKVIEHNHTRIRSNPTHLKSYKVKYWRKKAKEDPDVMLKSPVLVNQNGEILDGNHRLIANPYWELTVALPDGFSCPRCKIGKCSPSHPEIVKTAFTSLVLQCTNCSLEITLEAPRRRDRPFIL